MTFDPAKTGDFIANFERHKEQIRNFEGCEKLMLLQDINQPHVYFTYSWWQAQENLENYRHSALFKSVWKFTKTLFHAPAEAWSTTEKAAL